MSMSYKTARDQTRQKLLAAVFGLGLAGLVLPGCSAPPDRSPPEAALKVGGTTDPSTQPEPVAPLRTANVDIGGLGFSPGSLTVSVGTTVVWTNQNSSLQLIVSGPPQKPGGGPLDGKLDRKGSTYSYKFDVPGEYPYVDEITSWVGSVTVNP